MKKILIINFLDKQQWADEVPYLWLLLRSYFLRNSKDPNAWEWLDPLYSSYADSADEIVDNIVAQAPDVMGISCYIWNEKLTQYVAREVKKKLPSIRIVAGGPGVFLNEDKAWFSKYPYVDAVCEYTGFGEVFFTEYLDGTPLKDIPFCIYPTLGGAYWNKSSAKYDRKNFKFAMPYADNRDYLACFKKNHTKIKILIETSRGCPYACSFCEWGFTGSNKVIFKDLDALYEDMEAAFEVLEPMYFDVIDAKFGIIKENILLAEKVAELTKKHNNCLKYCEFSGPTKVKKENLKKIYEIMMSAGIDPDFKIAIQHTDDVVLKNIDRTDMKLEQQLDLFKSMIFEKQKDFTIQSIIGLPGDTPDKFYHMMDQMTVFPFSEPWCHPWVHLEGTPSAKPEYIKEMEIKTREFNINADSSEYDCIDQVVPREKYLERVNPTGKRRVILDQEWFPLQPLVVSTYSYGNEEWIEMNLFFLYHNFLRDNRIIIPIVSRLREKNVNIAEFYKGFFREFLMNNPILKKVYDDILANFGRDEKIDFEFVSLGPNFPYMSQRAIMKFVILLDTNEFFASLSQWLESKYGEDEHLKSLCAEMAATINSPGKKDIPLPQKIKECLQMCRQIMSEQDRLLPEEFKLK